MNRKYFARASTRALWVGGIAAVTLAASHGAARGASLRETADVGRDSINTAGSDATGGSDAADGRALVAGIPRDTVYGRSGKLRVTVSELEP